MRKPKWLSRFADTELRSVIVFQSVALYNAQLETREWKRIAERHAQDIIRLSTPTAGTTEAIQVAFWKEKAEQLLEDLRVFQNPSWHQ